MNKNIEKMIKQKLEKAGWVSEKAYKKLSEEEKKKKGYYKKA